MPRGKYDPGVQRPACLLAILCADSLVAVALSTTPLASAAPTPTPGPAPAAASSAPPAAASAPPDESRHDEAALRAIVDHWDRAEHDGDVAYLSQLLAPEYRSIGAGGEATTRAALLEQAERVQRSAEARVARRRAGEAFLRAHPTAVSVTVHGPVGIVSYYNPGRGLDHSVRGSDVFVYEGNRWHAVYALHNNAE